MAGNVDFWFVRLPDGRTLRARSTEALRGYVRTGRVPSESRVRRSEAGDWLPLQRVSEFANLVPEDQAGSRDFELRPVGLRGLVDELCSAFDSSLHRKKLRAAAATGFVAGLALLGGLLAGRFLDPPWSWVAEFGAILGFLIALGLCTTSLTVRTFVELSRQREPDRAEMRQGLVTYVPRVLAAQILVTVAFALLLYGFHALSAWIGSTAALDGGLLAVRLIVEVVGWPAFVLSLLFLGPILVVEDVGPAGALVVWLGLLRRHLGRIYVYEALVATLAAILMVPLLLPIVAASVGELSLVEQATLRVLAGLALTPLIAYLLVANVYLYLNLRYEFFENSRP